ncbi:MAG: hypothetical protein KF830_00005 [Planctomycetes bacterium]|nr:hypothetical protein [Planctomycetota bacterium]
MRFLALLSTFSLVAGAASAQCLNTAGGSPAGVTAWGFYPADDEGRSAPIDMLFGPAGFPMAGAAGPLTHAVVDSNGTLYLTSGGAAVGPVGYGPFDVDDLRGFTGDSPRVFPLWSDLEGPVAGWAINVDTSVPGAFKVNWIDVREYGSGGPDFSFSATLYATGVIDFSYGALPGLPNWAISTFAGVSIGGGVGTGLETSVDLTTNPDSGALGLLFQELDGSVPAFALRGVSLIPNGLGGYLSVVTCDAATHETYGVGCYTTQSSAYQLWTDMPSAKAALDGNGMLFAFNGVGYTATFVPGFAVTYVAPTGGATTLGVSDDGNFPITTSVPVPVPGGATAAWNVSVNGILTAAATANNAFDWTPTGVDLTNAGVAPNLAFYTWHDFNSAEVGSGPIQYEEIGGVLYVTWNGVECYGTPSPNVATWQFQVDLASGSVTMVWVSMNPATVAAASGDDTLVGITLAGPGPDAGSQLLSALPAIGADTAGLSLSAAPAPVINPSTLVTWTATNVPEFVPTSGVYLTTMFLSVNPLPGGIDLFFLGAPGCSAYIGTLDLDLGAQVTFAPTASWSLLFDNVNFAPGDVIAAQAISLNPLNPFGVTTSNGVRSTTQPQ